MRMPTIEGGASLTLAGIAICAALAALHGSHWAIPRSVFVASVGATAAIGLMLLFSVVAWALGPASLPAASPVPGRTAAAAANRQRPWRIAIAALSLLLFGAVIVLLASTGFGTDDEVYSWNMWAIQHVQRLPADLSFTNAPYPQLYPHWLAASYLSIGMIDTQWPARALSALATLVIAAAPLALIRNALPRRAFLWIVFAQLVVSYSLWKDLRLGYADPLMCACIALSFVCLVLYHRAPERAWLLPTAALLGVMAALTKQPGIVWGGVAVPLVLLTSRTVHSNLGAWAWPLALACCVASLWWAMWIAPEMTSNRGVIDRSLGDRGTAGTFFWALRRYFLLKPLLLILLLAALRLGWSDPLLRRVLCFGALPMLVLWLLFGSYQIRLGMHVLLLLQLIVVASVTASASSPDPDTGRAHEGGVSRRVLAASVAITLGFVAALAALTIARAEREGYDFSDAGPWVFRRNYGAGIDEVYRQIVRDQSPVWADNALAYGPLYGRTPMLKPMDFPEAQGVGGLQRVLLDRQVAYAVTAGLRRISSSQVEDLVAACPAAFARNAGEGAEWQQIVYRVDRHLLADCRPDGEVLSPGTGR